MIFECVSSANSNTTSLYQATRASWQHRTLTSSCTQDLFLSRVRVLCCSQLCRGGCYNVKTAPRVHQYYLGLFCGRNGTGVFEATALQQGADDCMLLLQEVPSDTKRVSRKGLPPRPPVTTCTNERFEMLNAILLLPLWW